MGYIAKEINRVIGVYHLKSHILSGKYTDDFRERIVKRYCDTNTTFIWESPVFPPVHPGTCKQTLLAVSLQAQKNGSLHSISNSTSLRKVSVRRMV